MYFSCRKSQYFFLIFHEHIFCRKLLSILFVNTYYKHIYCKENKDMFIRFKF